MQKSNYKKVTFKFVFPSLYDSTFLCLLFSSLIVNPLILHFPFAFGYWKIMIIFPTSGTLRNILQNNFSKTFWKHNLLFSNITIIWSGSTGFSAESTWTPICGSTGFSAESTWIQWPNRDTISRTVSATLINNR